MTHLLPHERNNKTLVLKAIKLNPLILSIVDKELRKDRESVS